MADGLARDTLAKLLQQQMMQGPNAGFNAGQMPDPRFINPEPTGLGGNPPPDQLQQILQMLGGMR